MAVATVIETGKRRVFASALDWPGWSRGARDEESALATLLDYADRFRPVVERAGLQLPKRLELEVVERVDGDAGTDFGMPAVAAAAESHALTAKAAARQAALLEAAWATLAEVVAAAPATLRKGPRGGGRDRDAVVEHVVNAERAYAGKIGLRAAAEGDLRAAILRVLSAPSDGSELRPGGWTSRYAARRIIWHVLDHAWEIEDRSQS
ncbi:MAG TPA: hypothetical protein VFH66_16405 [Mycobacteriales bacterium]|nr:hypothetical protein [Mycobacteriales bacterium]